MPFIAEDHNLKFFQSRTLMHLLRDTIAKSSSLGVTVMPGLEGSFRIYRENGIVMIEFFGWMTESLLEQAQIKLKEELLKTPKSNVLYNGLEMEDPSLTLTLLMQSFHESMRDRIQLSAIVVPGYRIAFLSRLAFGGQESKYRVFYNNRAEAIAWLSAPNATP